MNMAAGQGVGFLSRHVLMAPIEAVTAFGTVRRDIAQEAQVVTLPRTRWVLDASRQSLRGLAPDGQPNRHGHLLRHGPALG